ncbi:MAG: DUF4124 domain-containing protein [Gammaproteobacteria bacterium]|nr:DUF4124 domain-containing protein [Gammaproteobacteria bacterium]
MKLFAKLMIALLVIAMALPFTVLKDDSGKPLISFSDLKMPDFSLPDFGEVEQLAPTIDSAGSGKSLIYEWYDGAGNRNFSSEPPPEGVEYTVRGYDPDANVIQAVKLPDEAQPEEVAGGDAEPVTEPGEIGNPYSQENIDKLFEDARNIEKLLNQRLQQQEQAFNQ